MRRDSANVFIDRRLGEGNKKMSEEEKMFRRVQCERARQARRSKFALTDEDEDADRGTSVGISKRGRKFVRHVASGGLKFMDVPFLLCPCTFIPS